MHHVKVPANNNLILETTVYKESGAITTYGTLKIQPGESIDYDAVLANQSSFHSTSAA